MQSTKLFFCLVMVFILLTGTGCSLLKASEAPDYGFVPMPELLTEQPDHRPFNKAWVAGRPLSEVRQQRSQLYIPPVSTKILEERYASEIEDTEARVIQAEEAQELARYFANRCKLVLANYMHHPLTLAEARTAQSVTLELALVELSPTSPLINVIGSAAGYFVPGGGLVKIAGKGRVSMEGMIADGASGEYLERFKDREEDKASAFSLKDFQRYAHLRVAIDDWCDQLIAILAKPAEEDTEDSLPIAFNPF